MSSPFVAELGSANMSNPSPVSHPPQQIAQQNNWASMLGMPQIPTELDPYDETLRTTWTMPEGLRGNNKFLGQTLKLLLMANNTAIVQLFLPIVDVGDAMQVSWSRYIFPTQLPDVVPERGVVRLVRSARQSGSESMVRYGIGIFLTHGFMNTPMGRQHYLMSLKQVNESVLEGLQFDGLYAILTAQDWTKRYLREHPQLNRFRGKKMFDVMKRELQMWAYLQQTKDAWVNLDAVITQANSIYNTGVTLTHYLLDQRVMRFTKMIAYDQTTFMISGRPSPRTHDGVEARSRDSMGNWIYGMRTYLADEEGPITPMAQPTQIGEFIVACDRNVGKMRGYTTESRKVEFFDEDGNGYAQMHAADMLLHCNRFKPDGGLWSFNDPEAMLGNLDSFTQEEIDADFLHYLDADGERRPVAYFGNINKPHLGVQDYKDAGISALAKLVEDITVKRGNISTIITKGKRVLEQAGKYKFSVHYNNLLRALARKNADDGVEMLGGRGVPQPLAVSQWTGNSHGSLDLPTIGELANLIPAADSDRDFTSAAAANADVPLARNVQIAIATARSKPGTPVSVKGTLPTKYTIGTVTVTSNGMASQTNPNDTADIVFAEDLVAGYMGKFQLPPTHLTYGGLKTIAEAYSDGDIQAMGFSESSAKIISDLVYLIDNIVESFRNYYPGSIFLSPDFANAWTANPTPQDTFFESVFMQDISVNPIFLRFPDSSASGASREVLTVSQADIDAVDAIQKAFPGAESSRGAIAQTVLGNIVPASQVRSTSTSTSIGVEIGGTDADKLVYADRQFIMNDMGIMHSKRISVDHSGAANAFMRLRRGNDYFNDHGRSISVMGGEEVTDEAKRAYDNLVRWTHLFRPTESSINRTNEDSLKRTVRGAALTSMVLSVLQMVRRDGDEERTLLRFAAVMKKMEELIGRKVNDVAATTVDSSNNPNEDVLGRFVTGMTEFFAERPDLLQSQNPDGVHSLLGTITEAVVHFDVSKHVQSTNSKHFGTAVDTETVKRLFVRLEAHRESFVRAPIVVSHKAMTSFGDFLGQVKDVPGGVDVVYGWPSGSKNTQAVVSAAELINGISAGRELPTFQQEKLGSIYMTDRTFIAQNIEHSSIIRKAFQLSNSNEYEDHDSVRGSSRMPDYGFGNKASRILGKSQVIGGSIRPFDRNPYVESVKRQRTDNTSGASINRENRGRHSFEKIPASARDSVRDALAFQRTDSYSVTDSIFGGVSREPSFVKNAAAAGKAGSGDYGETDVNAYLAKHISANFASMYTEISKRLLGIVRMAALCFLGTPVTMDSMKATLENDLMHPFNYILCRPHARYVGLTVTKMVPGLATGRTNLGQILVEMGDDAATTTHHANIRYTAAAMITEPKNIFNAQNVLIVDYNGGLGKGFYQRETYNPNDDEYGDDGDSFFVFAIPRNERPTANPISLTGHYGWVENADYQLADEHFSAMTHSTAPYNNGWWRFHDARFNVPLGETSFKKYRHGERTIPNSLSFLSYCAYYNSISNRFDAYTNQTGHWKIQSVGEGMAPARISLKSMDNNPSVTRLQNMNHVPMCM